MGLMMPYDKVRCGDPYLQSIHLLDWQNLGYCKSFVWECHQGWPPFWLLPITSVYVRFRSIQAQCWKGLGTWNISAALVIWLITKLKRYKHKTKKTVNAGPSLKIDEQWAIWLKMSRTMYLIEIKSQTFSIFFSESELLQTK